MRVRALFLVAALAACQPAEPPPLPEPAQQNSPIWFICDAIDAPAVLVVARDGEAIQISEYDKPNGAIVDRTEYVSGAVEGAAGSILTPLLRGGADAGVVRQMNPDVLETPGSAYTAPFTSVQLGERRFSCRWLPRTRLMGFTGRRSFVVHEDADGDLIYTSYDFTSAADASAIELSGNARTTTFSTEVRGGHESVGPRGAEFRFNTEDRYTYAVSVSNDDEAMLQVLHNGAWTQTEPLIAYVRGGAE